MDTVVPLGLRAPEAYSLTVFIVRLLCEGEALDEERTGEEVQECFIRISGSKISVLKN